MRSMTATAFAALACVSLAGTAHAEWPNDKPIEVVVGFAAGGGTDIMARKLFNAVQRRLGEKASVIVLNKPGASGEIANAYVAKSKPDGYTIGIINVPSFLFVPMSKSSQFSPADFRLIARVVDDPTVLVVKSSSAHGDLAKIIEALKAKPKSISFGHNGDGSNGHLALLMLAGQTKAEFNEISYKGTANQKTDLAGGHLDVALISAGEVPELHGGKTGDFKVVAQLVKTRSQALPNVPTAQEAAGISVLMSSERGVAVPKAVPDTIAQRLETAIAETLKDPEFIAAAGGDAPVLAYLSGAHWQVSLGENAKTLKAIIDKMPK